MTERFYALEGLDATGKTTVLNGLRDKLRVYKTPPEEMAKFRDMFDGDIDARFIYFLSSVLCIAKQIEQTGGICDRYLLTTIAAHEAMGVSPELIESLMPVLRGIPKPDNTFLLTARPEVIEKRMAIRGANKTDLANRKINGELLEGYKKWARKLGHALTEVDTSDIPAEEVIWLIENEIGE